MKKLATLVATVALCACGDTNMPSRVIVQAGYTAPTCSVATADGEMCVEGDLETNANLDVAGTATLTGAVTMGSTLAMTGDLTVTGNDITFGNGGTISNATNGAITIGEASEDLVCTFTVDTATYTTNTGVTLVDYGTINLATDALDLSEGNITNVGDIQLDSLTADAAGGILAQGTTLTSGGTDDYGVKITHTLNDSGAAGGTDLYNGILVDVTETDKTGWDNVNLMDLQVGSASKFLVDDSGNVTAAGSSKSAQLIASHDVIRFCGNGPNATTAKYVGPVVVADYSGTGADMTFGAAGCDANDDPTEGTADAPWHPALGFNVVGMHCVSTCGADDTMTLTLRDDTADVTGVTCDITLNGTNATCQVLLSSGVAVAAGSELAIKAVNSTDDNCDAGDLECRVFIDY